VLKLLLLVLAIIATACTLHAYIGLVVISTIVETHTAENVSQLLLWITWNLIGGGRRTSSKKHVYAESSRGI